MVATIQFGNGTSCELELDSAAHVRTAAHEAVAPEQLAEQVRVALEQPLGYPPLAEATVPGDRVVVTLQRGLPEVRKLLAGTSTALCNAGVELTQASVLLANAHEELSDVVELRTELHDAANDDDCAYVGVTQSGQALRINRKLSDADIVLPIGLTSVAPNEQQCDKYCGLFPHYCDRETIARYRDFKRATLAELHQEQLREIDELGWLLGVGIAIQVVPGQGGTVAAVLAGEPSAVAKAATEKYRELWSQPVAARSDLVIATINGASAAQSWDDLARALTVAEGVLEPGGTIALCSQLTESPGASLERLGASNDYVELERELRRDKFADTCAALQLCGALERGPVYLHSRLDDNLVEGLGLMPIASDAELRRLAESYQRPLVLEDAHRLLPTLCE